MPTKPLPWLEKKLKSIGEFQRTSRDSTTLDSSDLKGRVDLVTEIDKTSEQRLVETILSEHPEDSILAEEESRVDGSNNREWIIDPLDGTTNYVHNHPFYGISVALTENDRLKHGLAYFPELDDFYHSTANEGAYKNGEQLGVSQTTRSKDSFLATGFADLRSEEMHNRYNVDVFPDIIEKVQGIRRGGSAVHDLCLVAEGVFDGFWEFNLQPWDVAAGVLFIREAGGDVSDMLDGENWLNGKNIVASNGKIQQSLLKWLEPHLPQDFPNSLKDK